MIKLFLGGVAFKILISVLEHGEKQDHSEGTHHGRRRLIIVKLSFTYFGRERHKG